MDPTDPNFGGLLSGLFGMGATPSLPPGVNPVANAAITQAAMQPMNPDGTAPDAGSQYATGTPIGAVTLPPPRPAGIGDAPNLPTMANGGTGPDLPSAVPGSPGASPGLDWNSLAKKISGADFSKIVGGAGATAAKPASTPQAPMVQAPRTQAQPFSMAALSQYMPGRRQGSAY